MGVKCRFREGRIIEVVDNNHQVHYFRKRYDFCRKLQCEGIFYDIKEAESRCRYFRIEKRKGEIDE